MRRALPALVSSQWNRCHLDLCENSTPELPIDLSCINILIALAILHPDSTIEKPTLRAEPAKQIPPLKRASLPRRHAPPRAPHIDTQ